MFKDRQDAGKKLAQALNHYEKSGVLVLAIPRGGVEIGYEVAKGLSCDLALLVCRKLPFPNNPESGFGAIAEDGSLYLNKAAATHLSDEEIAQIIEHQQQEIQRRIDVLRGGKPLPPIEGRTVILVDDGIAMGSTMHAAVQMCQNNGAKKIIVAVPVAGERSIHEFSKIADEMIVLESPAYFRAVAQVYEQWHDVSDAEVSVLLKRFELS